MVNFKQDAEMLHPQERDCIWITRSELDTLDKINNQDMQLVTFTLLCFAKLNNLRCRKNNGLIYIPVKKLFELARVKVKKKDDRYLMIHDIYMLGLIEFKNLTAIRVTFIDDDSEKVLPISDFREPGREYLFYKGGSFIRCLGCGLLIPKRTNTRYCPKCRDERSKPAKKPLGKKQVVCEDCGKSFLVSVKNNKTCRCDECQRKNDRKRKRDWKRKEREHKRSDSAMNVKMLYVGYE